MGARPRPGWVPREETNREEQAVNDARAVADAWMKAFDEHDEAGMRALTAPDARLTAPPELVIEGEPAMTEYAMAWLRAFPDATTKVHHETASGQTVVQEFTFEGTHRAPLVGPSGEIPATNKHLTGRGAQSIDIRDGKVSEVRLYFDEVQVLAQLGLMPTPAQG